LVAGNFTFSSQQLTLQIGTNLIGARRAAFYKTTIAIHVIAGQFVEDVIGLLERSARLCALEVVQETKGSIQLLSEALEFGATSREAEITLCE